MTRFRRRVLYLTKQPFFWVLTIGGNGIVVIGALLLWHFEASTQAGPSHFMDYLLWSMGIITTVGFGNFVPQTLAGKWTVFFLMALGTLFLWSYMGFLVTALLAPELAALEREVHDVEKELKQTRHTDS